ncbi:CoA pyrophosphatase [Sinorhizobium alkalisoli]|uniref:Coenzyme A pyrophosphatase n=1 Tax=Sinorhizobium alkalisoli TaxID=1752398 RepID=A0A1E3VD98_9HYPH|nr:CoA pyrophosphatase [Sinorhizobium alkalisoli]MCA1490841.1 CoA pyrophosphatase [Ensifer sp. NBAIM29]MCG5479060.1 CoA pyrophosphatase [Sinorhizobium alkalisoli]ODR91552.1 coenzyme A pyrophosphatase [Sinorhizobium alkalisoli]QFI67238.1 nudix hydrolase YeaB [Sinorhizobium alkalisoli]
MSRPLFSAEEFRRRARKQTGGPVETSWRDHGDFLLNPGIVPYLETLNLKDAAVLVPVVDDGEDASVIFTQRTSTLRKHSGQVAFPGGAVDPEDPSVEMAAVREAEEEIGLDPRFVDPVGRLPHYMALSGFRITPVLAVVQPGFELVLNPVEVESVFQVPLSFLMDPKNHGRGSRHWDGAERHFYRMPYGERNIWGITAGIVRMLYERLYA